MGRLRIEEEDWYRDYLYLETENAVINNPGYNNPEVVYYSTGKDLVFEYDAQNKVLVNPSSGFYIRTFSNVNISDRKDAYGAHYLNPCILNTRDKTAVDIVHMNTSQIQYINGTVLIDAPQQIHVFSAHGAEIETAFADRFDLNHLPKGIYIVRAGNNSIKVVR